MPQLANRDAHENRIARQLGALGLLGLVMKQLGPNVDKNNLTADFWLFIQDKLKSIFTNELDTVFRDAWAMNEAAMAYTFPADILDQWLWRNVEQYGISLASSLVNTQRRDVEKYVRQYFDNQWTQRTLRDKLTPTFGAKKAQQIARTEVTRAAGQATDGMMKSLRSQGIQATQIWRTREDEIVAQCPICFPLDNKLQGVDWMLPPPAHPNCRCWTDIIIQETA